MSEGVYIKGMEMPKSCSRCFCMASCRLWKNIMHPEFNRHRNCPLVPVPPHGRCVDADKLIQEMRLFIKENMLSRDDARELLETIEDAPTVIEAEEGET